MIIDVQQADHILFKEQDKENMYGLIGRAIQISNQELESVDFTFENGRMENNFIL